MKLSDKITLTAGNNQPAAVSKGWAILKGDMVNKLPKLDVFNMVLVCVARAFADMNVKEISEADRDYLVNELTDNILKYHPHIRLNEIPEAIALGIRGRFGEFYSLSVVTFLRFIEQYLLSEKRTGLVKDRPADAGAPKPAPDLETQFNTARGNAKYALQRKQNGKDLATLASPVYNFLDKLQLVQFTAHEKNDMMADATRELIKDLKFKLILAREAERTAIKNNIEAYTKAITEHAKVSDRQLTLVKMCAKKLALEAFLNNIMLEETDLDELIESRKELFMKHGKARGSELVTLSLESEIGSREPSPTSS